MPQTHRKNREESRKRQHREKTDRTPFPDDIYHDTFCGERRSLYASHSVYSETGKQRNLLYGYTKMMNWQPPKQTCCAHQVKSIMTILETRLAENPTT